LREEAKDVSGCSTAPYDIPFLIRNEEVAGSIQVSSTKQIKPAKSDTESYFSSATL
jgi:hypothetical protein